MGANNEQPDKGGEGGPCGIRHADPSADTKRTGRDRALRVVRWPPDRLRCLLSSESATVARLRTQGRKRVSGMSGHAHAAKELLLHRLGFEKDYRG